MYIILISALISYSNIDMNNDEPIHLTTGVWSLGRGAAWPSPSPDYPPTSSLPWPVALEKNGKTKEPTIYGNI